MFLKNIKNIAFIIIIILFGCNYNNNSPKKNKIIKKNKTVKDISNLKNETIKKPENFFLNEKNAIPFFYEYEKENKENKIKIITSYGDIEIELFKNTPYHRANFIYLTKEKTNVSYSTNMVLRR